MLCGRSPTAPSATTSHITLFRLPTALLPRQNGILELLGNSLLDDRLGGNLNRLAGGRVAAHARLALLDHQLHHSRQHELSRALEIFLGEHVQLVEELTRLRPLHFE